MNFLDGGNSLQEWLSILTRRQQKSLVWQVEHSKQRRQKLWLGLLIHAVALWQTFLESACSLHSLDIFWINLENSPWICSTTTTVYQSIAAKPTVSVTCAHFGGPIWEKEALVFLSLCGSEHFIMINLKKNNKWAISSRVRKSFIWHKMLWIMAFSSFKDTT